MGVSHTPQVLHSQYSGAYHTASSARLAYTQPVLPSAICYKRGPRAQSSWVNIAWPWLVLEGRCSDLHRISGVNSSGALQLPLQGCGCVGLGKQAGLSWPFDAALCEAAMLAQAHL